MDMSKTISDDFDSFLGSIIYKWLVINNYLSSSASASASVDF